MADLYGAGRYTGVNRIGGGEGYTDVFTAANCDHVARSTSELLDIFSRMSTGQRIFVPWDNRISLYDTILTTPKGIVIAGDLGLNGSPGGLLENSHVGGTKSFPYCIELGDGSRMTGLRVKGGYFDEVNRPTGKHWGGVHTGLASQVDNCDFSGWINGALVPRRHTGNAHLHHNYIHDNPAEGFGYGIYATYVSNTRIPLIECNLFWNNRHDLAGHGGSESGNATCYEFRYNIHKGGNGNVNHAHVDCHGGTDVDDPYTPAGDTLLVYYNTWLSAAQESVKLRGIPRKKGLVHGNWTRWLYQGQSGLHTQIANECHAFYQCFNMTSGGGPDMRDKFYNGIPTDESVYINFQAFDNWYGPNPAPNMELRKMAINVEVMAR